ncbi:UNVERIFIED_CONTAM: hypothetical protein HDU68_011658 [Siphonaria sp. JEL0065]|nr:hypothetical protein HDU68_011658 [Siphonaria sp. JEL0065]
MDCSTLSADDRTIAIEAYEWWFGRYNLGVGCSNNLQIVIPPSPLALPAALLSTSSEYSPLMTTPLLMDDEMYWSDSTSQSPNSATKPVPPPSSTITTTFAKPEPLGLFGDDLNELTFLEFVQPDTVESESEACGTTSSPVQSVQSHCRQSTTPPPSSPIIVDDQEIKPLHNKPRSNSVGSLYQNIDISACKKTKKPSRRGSVTIFSCPFPDCPRSFDRSFNLRAHYSTHLGMKMFTCEGCSKKFTRRFDVKRHQSGASPCNGFEILVGNQ